MVCVQSASGGESSLRGVMDFLFEMCIEGSV